MRVLPAWAVVLVAFIAAPLVTWWPMLGLMFPGLGMPAYPPAMGIDVWQSQLFWLLGCGLVAALVGQYDRWLGVTLAVVGSVLFWRGIFVPQMGLWKGMDPTHSILFALGALGLWSVRLAPHSIHRSLRSVAATLGAFEASYMLQQHLFQYDLLWGPWFGGQLNATVKPLGTLGTVDAASAFVAITATLMPWWLLPLPIAAVTISQSLGATIALVIGLGIKYAYMGGGHHTPGFLSRHSTRPRRLMLMAAGLAPVAYYVATRIVSLNKLWPRLQVWAFGLWDAAHVNLATGYGLGGWSRRIPALQIELKNSPTGELWAQAHSEYVQWACELGLVGVVLALGWLWANRAMFRHPQLGGAISALAVTCASFFTFHVVATALLGILLVGLATAEPETVSP